MKASAKAIYACRAILELAAAHPAQEPVHLETVAKRQEIPLKYLSQIITQLRQAGLVVSRRGSKGGHALGKPPAEITLGDVLRAVEGPLVRDDRAAGVGGRRAASAGSDGVSGALGQFKEAVDQAADRITFDGIVKASNRAVYYI